MSRLSEKYKSEVIPALSREFGYHNPRQIPRIEKVVINVGAGRALADNRVLESAISSLSRIGGQAPVATVAKHSIAGFKLRAGNKIGAKVTLRGQRMYEFLDRLISVTLPRVRDFRGLARSSVDPQGNFSIGISDQTIFPEIASDELGSHGLQINIVTTAKTKEEGLKLLQFLGLPLRKEQ